MADLFVPAAIALDGAVNVFGTRPDVSRCPVILQRPPIVGQPVGASRQQWETGRSVPINTFGQFLTMEELEQATVDALPGTVDFWGAKVRLRADATQDGDPLGNPGNRLSGTVTRLFVGSLGGGDDIIAVVETPIGWMVCPTSVLEIVE